MDVKKFIKEYGYDFLYEEFDDKKIGNRINALAKRALSFIEHNSLDGIVGLNQENLMICVIDYFADIYRLKKFHKIDHINTHKIYSYILWWWLRRKPLQIINNNVAEESLVYINEKFMTQWMFYEMVRTSKEDTYKGIICLDKHGEAEQEFLQDIEYFLRYRIRDAYSIELALQTFEFALKAINEKR